MLIVIILEVAANSMLLPFSDTIEKKCLEWIYNIHLSPV